MLQWRMQMTVPNEILLAEVGNLLDEGKDVILLTKGNSMLPFIRGEKDSVLLRKSAPESLTAGDIVLAEVAPKQYVLHRVLSCDGDVLYLKGDGNVRGKGERCRRKDVLGSVVEVIRPDGRHSKPAAARFWLSLHPFARKCFLALYRRIALLIV